MNAQIVSLLGESRPGSAEALHGRRRGECGQLPRAGSSGGGRNAERRALGFRRQGQHPAGAGEAGLRGHDRPRLRHGGSHRRDETGRRDALERPRRPGGKHRHYRRTRQAVQNRHPAVRHLPWSSASRPVPGAETVKLKYGHRGANQPVRDTETGRVYITSQNHGYAVVGDSCRRGRG